MVKKLLPIFIVTLLALILVGIKVYPRASPIIKSTLTGDKNSEVEDGQIKIDNGENSGQVSGQHRNKLLSATFPFERKEYEELAKKYQDQFNIIKRMYYSWDFIKNAEGKFEYSHYKSGTKNRVQFYVDFDKKKNRSRDEQLQNNNVIEIHNVLLKNNIVIRQKPNKNIYNEKSIKDTSNQSVASFENEFLGLYNSPVINSEWWTLLYNNYSNWSYKEGTKFGMPVYQIKGEIPSKISESLKGPFTMTVSKETGVLLDLKCFGQEDKVIESVTVKSIQINKGIQNEEAIFQLDVSSDKELSNKDFNMSDLGASTGGKKTGWD